MEERWADGKQRCGWANPANPRYVAYHDCEWGVPTHDDAELFELLILECFQAGLSWECILNKREGFRAAFDGFELDAVCAYGPREVERLLADARIVRNRRKVSAAIANGQPIAETGPATSPLSDAISADLKRRGMSFVGSTVVYAYLQSAGLIQAHEEGCYLHGRHL